MCLGLYPIPPGVLWNDLAGKNKLQPACIFLVLNFGAVSTHFHVQGIFSFSNILQTTFLALHQIDQVTHLVGEFRVVCNNKSYSALMLILLLRAKL